MTLTTPPRHPQFANKIARHATYNMWPLSLSQQPDQLVDAGFYYTGGWIHLILGLVRADKIGTVQTHDFWTVLGRSGTIGPSSPKDRLDFGPSGRFKTVVLTGCRGSKSPNNVGNCGIWPCVCYFWSQWSIKCEIKKTKKT